MSEKKVEQDEVGRGLGAGDTDGHDRPEQDGAISLLADAFMMNRPLPTTLTSKLESTYLALLSSFCGWNTWLLDIKSLKNLAKQPGRNLMLPTPMGRPRKNPVPPGDSASAVIIEGKGSHVEETPPTKGRKKRVATDRPSEGSQRKRAKVEATLNELPRAKKVVVKVAAKTTRTRSAIVVPKWKVIINSVRVPESTTEKATSFTKTLSPRIWTGSREELLALLPELAGTKCFNGISWYKFPAPMVVLDDTNRCFEIERQEAQPLCLDLVTTRSFVSPIPTMPAQLTKDPAAVASSSNPGVTSGVILPSKVKAPMIRKAPRYRAPKLLAGSNITAKVEYVPAASLSPMEPPSTHISSPVTTSAPPAAVYAPIPQLTLPVAPDVNNAAAMPPASPINLPASSDEGPISGHGSRLLPRTWNQVTKLEEMMDNARQISSMYRPSRAVTTPAASWDGPSHPSNVFPYRLSVQSTGNTPQASSSKLTLDDVYLPGGSSQSSYSMPPNAPSVSAHEFLMVDHAPATMAMQMYHAHLNPNPSASFDPPSPQPDISTKAASVRMPIMKDETSNNVNLASEGAMPSDSQQAAAPQHGSGPIVLRETMNRMDSAPMASGVVPTVRPEQTSVPVMIDDMATEMNLLTANDMSPLPKAESGATAKTEAHDATTLDDFIPPQLPDEIAALVDAYVFGRPLSVMISRDRLKESWGVEVKKEFGYVMLGFFKILGLQEIRVKGDNIKASKLANGLCAGQVQWRFHLEWAPGGEEIILPSHPKGSFDWPWWNEEVKDATPSAAFETSVSSEAETQETSPNDGAQTDEPEIRYPTTPRYRQARIANHEYKFRHCLLSDAYDSVVPEQVLAPFGRQHSDRVLPRGWLCTKCEIFKSRRPVNLLQDEPAPTDPYYYDLYWIRDPQERLPLNYPRNTYPTGTKVSRTNWKDGTQTFGYYINENSNVYIKHIFLGNVAELQKPMSNLMDQVQLTVPLLRPMVDNNPYFFYTAKCPKSNTTPTKKPWDGVPDCINDAKKQVVDRTSWFAEIPEKNIWVEHIKIVAWITEGSKRGNEVIRAKKQCAILLAMGCTTLITVTPQSLEKNKTPGRKSDPQENPLEDVESGWVAVGGTVDDEPGGSAEDVDNPLEPAIIKKRRGPPKKKDRPSFTLSLYHGDMVVFYGDDFEYQLIKSEPSVLVQEGRDFIHVDLPRTVGALLEKGAKRAKQGQTSKRALRSQLSKSLMATNETQSATKDNWGRVLICGGTDWPKLGKKERPGATPDILPELQNPDLLEPHLLRSLLNVKSVSVHTSCTGCHFVVIDIEGNAWLFGRNGFSCLGVQGPEYISENAPRLVRATDLGAAAGTTFVHAACGRNHTLLVGSDGTVWAAGQNNLGQCGQNVCPEISRFTAVNVTRGGNKENIVKASAGVTFSIVLSESGKVFSFGSAEKGQLGNGTTGERITTGNKTSYDIETVPVYVRELDGKKIVDIASGQQHTIAIDEAGVIYVWGYNGYCRLGLGNQVDVLKPKVVPQFSGPNDNSTASAIASGPTSSVVVDKQGMFYIAGKKYQLPPLGSSGSPHSTFRFIQDIMGCKVLIARSGGVTHWLVTPDDDGSPMTVCWGQNANNGELGLGAEERKSASKPTRNLPLVGVDVIDIAAGQNTTLLIARPADKFAEMPRHPEEVNPPPMCVCNKDYGEDDSPLECDKCDAPWHLKCLDPPLDGVPDGEWFCPDCIDEPGAPVGRWAVSKEKKGNAKKRALSPSGDGDGGDANGKRKAASKAKTTLHQPLRHDEANLCKLSTKTPYSVSSSRLDLGRRSSRYTLSHQPMCVSYVLKALPTSTKPSFFNTRSDAAFRGSTSALIFSIRVTLEGDAASSPVMLSAGISCSGVGDIVGHTCSAHVCFKIAVRASYAYPFPQ
ncbi:hypothetical protein D9619_006834 [Psilocybe cf. subviscida]|uniref:PHD-type domain-containing protein n=1 Tax=Psilocybe cf. subviscida TaxID=2480587 RepID=A0A8H5B3X4_9AGAR|nr:hypothetical protein D9619_006834 [Psilocybe cf. subviscida]